jgi:PAS domain S-box-containing protein
MKTPVSILLLEDNEGDRLAFRRLVQRRSLPYAVTECARLAEARARLSQQSFDLIVADYHLPDGHGTELCREARHTPFILLTGTLGESLALRALEQGVDDYLPKLSDFSHLEPLPFVIEKTLRRKQLHDRAEETLRLQAAALQSAADAIMITDFEGAIQWINPGFTQLTGYADSEVVGQNPRVLISGRHPRDFYADLWKTVKSGHVWKGEIINRRKGGTLFTGEMTVTPVADEQGRWTHFIAIQRDITERKQAEELLRGGEAHLRTVLENLMEGVVVADLDGNALDWNRAALDMHGFSDLAEGRQPLAALGEIFEFSEGSGASLPLDQWPLSRILRGEKLRAFTLHIRRKSQDWQRIFNYSGSLVRDAEGKPFMAVMTISDVTGRNPSPVTSDK